MGAAFLFLHVAHVAQRRKILPAYAENYKVSAFVLFAQAVLCHDATECQFASFRERDGSFVADLGG
ncbi:hypothetical protein [Bradyrhizobium ivorense]|uniref:hypothetical protein n=1 Tax=Bradyrhizobium ivorense TaxID=2511166 RepID=UPI00155A70D4|nr:hypothetical protein [Bradyrhizobium ivorense]